MNEIEEEYFKLKEAMERKKEIEIKTHQYQMEMIKRKMRKHPSFTLMRRNPMVLWEEKEITWIYFEIDVDVTHSSLKRYNEAQIRWGLRSRLDYYNPHRESSYPFQSTYYLISKKYKKIIGMKSNDGWEDEYVIGRDLITEYRSSEIPNETHPQVKKLLREFLDSLGVDEDVSP